MAQSNEEIARLADLIEGVAGEFSSFEQLRGFSIDGVDLDTAVLPEGWRGRLVRVQNANTAAPAGEPRFTGWCLDKEDLFVAKLCALREGPQLRRRAARRRARRHRSHRVRSQHRPRLESVHEGSSPVLARITVDRLKSAPPCPSGAPALAKAPLNTPHRPRAFTLRTGCPGRRRGARIDLVMRMSRVRRLSPAPGQSPRSPGALSR
jgi:hypothetical protein